jgi:hypothetical protein
MENKKSQPLLGIEPQFRGSPACSLVTLGYGLDDRGIVVRLPAEAKDFYLLHSVQIDSGAQPASYPMSTESSLPVGGRGVKVTTHLQPVPRIRMHSPISKFMECRLITNRENLTLLVEHTLRIQRGKFDSSHLWLRFPQVTTPTRDIVGYFVEEPYNLTGKILTITHFNIHFIPVILKLRLH